VTRQILISDAAYERLCVLAGQMRHDSGEAVTFGDVVDRLLTEAGQ
jgi:hypothetical protein